MKLGLRALRGALAVTLLTSVAVPFAAGPALAVAPSGTVELLSPTSGETVGGDPTFAWTPVAGAVKYRVQVSRSDLFDTTVYNTDVANVYATPPAALPVGDLYWRVAPTDGGAGVGTFTSGSFTRVWADAPVLTSPGDGATLTYPEDPLLFTWQPLAGAQKYNVQIDDDMNFINPLTNVTTNNTSYTLADPQTNDQTFYWRVQGVSGTVVSPWTEPRSYDVEWPATPVLLSPASGATVTDVVLQWSPVAGAATYQLQVSPNEDFSNNVTVDVVTKGTRYSPATTLGNGSYFWRVRSRDAKATPNLGAWNSALGEAPAVFTRAWNAAPTLVSPADETFDVNVPTLRWTPVPYASHYEIQLGTDSNFTPQSYVSCMTNQTSFTPYELTYGNPSPSYPGACGLLPNSQGIGGVYYWRVRGVDAPGGILGLFSTPFSFMLKHTQVPALDAVEPGLVGPPVLSWEPVLGVAKYQVTIKVNGGNLTGTPAQTYSTSYTPSGLVSGETYQWYVQTLDDQGRLGLEPMQAAWGQFTYTAATPESTVTTLLGPEDGASSPVYPSMSWAPVTGAVEYFVYEGVDGTNTYSLLGKTKSTAYTATAVPPTPDTYRWTVRPVNATGQEIGTVFPSATFVIDSLPLVTGMTPEKCTPDTVCTTAPETPRLEWTPTAYTGGYYVYVANDASFTNVVRTFRTQYPSLTPRESMLDSAANQAYYWFVVPCRDAKANKGCGRFDNTVFDTGSAFRKRSLGVELVSPAHGATVPSDGTSTENVTFSWTEYATTNANAGAAQGARRYRVQVSTVADFATVLDQQDVDQTTYTPWDKTYPEGPLYWRVAAIDGSSNVLTWSSTRQVVKATPSLTALHPAPGITVSGTPYFQWTAQAHAKQYELEIYGSGDTLFSVSNRVSVTTTRLTAYTPLTSLAAGNYAWRVRRLDADARPGSWTSGGLFTIATSAPELLTPAPATVFTTDSMLFTWTAVTGAARYLFQSSKSASFSPTVESVKTVMTAWAPTAKYTDGTVHWRVSVLDAADNVIAVSTTRTVVKDGTAPTVTAKTPISNAALSGQAFTVTFSEPVRGVSTSTFLMKTATSAQAVTGIVTPGAVTETTTATFKPVAVLTPGESYTLSLTAGVTDLNGNALTPFSWTVRTVLTVDSSSTAVQAFWDRDTSSSASGGGYLASRTVGAKVSYTFTGTSASILGRRGPDGGYGDVYLDGTKVATATFYSSSARWKQVVWSKTGLAAGPHKVELRVMGTKPSASTAPWVFPDAFRYGSTTLEETSAAVVQSWKTVGLSGALGASYLLNTHYAAGDNGTQPYMTLKFKGTGVSWKGIRGTSGGIAAVYVDGALKAKVDTYGTASSSGYTLWSTSGLSNTTHTLKIVVTGARRSGSGGYNVTVDSFGVV